MQLNFSLVLCCIAGNKSAPSQMHGRVSTLLAMNEIAKRIAKQPHRYPAGADAAFGSRRLANVNAAAKTFLRNQRYREARETAFSGLYEAPSWGGAATILLSLVLGLPPATALHSALRSVKRRMAPQLARRPPRTPQQAAAELDLSRAWSCDTRTNGP
jgi:hypothetical protein